MIKTTIGGMDVQQWITSYRIDNPPVYGNNSFTDITGQEVTDKLGDKVILYISMQDIPHDKALQLAKILQADSVTVDYTTPIAAVGEFKKTAYTSSCEDADPDADYDDTSNITWDIDVTLESIVYAAASGDSL